MLRAKQGRMTSLLTFNAGLQALPVAGRWKAPLAKFSAQRLAVLPDRLRAVGADIIALQEIYHVADRAFIANALKEVYPFHFADSERWSLIGNGLMMLSRFPIRRGHFTAYRGTPLSLRVLWEQGFLSVDIDVPGFGMIPFFDVHLSAGKPFGDFESEETRRHRAEEIAQLLAAARDHDPILIGDFNTSPGVCAENYRQILASNYLDSHAALHGELDGTITWDSSNPYNRNGVHSHEPSQRVDHILLPANGRYLPRSTEVVLREPLLRSEGQTYTLSDHYGMLAVIAGQQTDEIS
jgi:endonuclease/exonuclease/phosphatase family metal-dependent hydrolase